MDKKTSDNPLMQPDHELPAPHDMLIEAEEKDGIPTDGGISNNKPQPEKKKSFPLWILLVIVLLIAIMGGAMYILNSQQKPEVAKVAQVQPTVTPTPDPMSGEWITYTNQETNISFLYPEYLSINNEVRISGSSQTQHNPLACFANSAQIVSGSDAPFDGFCVYVEDRKKLSFSKYVDQQKSNILSVFGDEAISREKEGTQSALLINNKEISLLKNFAYGNTDYYFIPYTQGTNVLVIAKNDYNQEESLDPVMEKILQSLIFSVNLSTSPSKAQESTSSGNQVACTMDAKLCPDGSSVGRVGPKCEFKACPE